MLAKVEQQNDGYWSVKVGNHYVISDESHTVATNVAEAINHPERWEPSEAYEIADLWHRYTNNAEEQD
jgi:hypothetical protein